MVKAIQNFKNNFNLKMLKEFKGDSTMVLKNVHELEEDVQNMLIEVGRILENNFPGPETYITYYKTYYYLLNGTETKALNAFFDNDPFPLLNVCTSILKMKILASSYLLFLHIFQEFNDWVIKYMKINNDILKLKDRVELNLMILDISEVNQNLKNIVRSLKNRILDYYMNLTQQTVSE